MVKVQKPDAPVLLFERAQQMGLNPSWITPNGLFAISVAGRERYVNFACSPLNSHTGVSLARDKYLARLIFERHEMQNIPFARPTSHEEATAFLAVHEKIIAKPVRGFGAKDIHIITDASQLQALQIDAYILEKYIAGQELRYLVLNDAVIGVHRSDYGESVDEMRYLERISYPKAAWDAELEELSIEVARAFDLSFVAVDYMIDDSGRAYILEINTTPGFKWFHAPSEGPVVDVARHFMEAMVENEAPLVTARTAA